MSLVHIYTFIHTVLIFKIFWPWCLSSSTFCSILQVKSRQRRLIDMNTKGKCWWYFHPLGISVQWNLHCFQGPRNWPNFFLQGSFLYNYFTITGEKKIFFYTKDFILQRFTIEFPLTLRADALRSRKINGPLLTGVSYCHIW